MRKTYPYTTGEVVFLLLLISFSCVNRVEADDNFNVSILAEELDREFD